MSLSILVDPCPSPTDPVFIEPARHMESQEQTAVSQQDVGARGVPLAIKSSDRESDESDDGHFQSATEGHLTGGVRKSANFGDESAVQGMIDGERRKGQERHEKFTKRKPLPSGTMDPPRIRTDRSPSLFHSAASINTGHDFKTERSLGRRLSETIRLLSGTTREEGRHMHQSVDDLVSQSKLRREQLEHTKAIDLQGANDIGDPNCRHSRHMNEASWVFKDPALRGAHRPELQYIEQQQETERQGHLSADSIVQRLKETDANDPRVQVTECHWAAERQRRLEAEAEVRLLREQSKVYELRLSALESCLRDEIQRRLVAELEAHKLKQLPALQTCQRRAHGNMYRAFAEAEMERSKETVKCHQSHLLRQRWLFPDAERQTWEHEERADCVGETLQQEKQELLSLKQMVERLTSEVLSLRDALGVKKSACTC